MARADIRRGTTAEVDKVQGPALYCGLLRVVFNLAGEGIRDALDPKLRK